MNKDDFEYARLLLDSSFKESKRFWTRNAGFWVVQAVLINFFFTSITSDDSIADLKNIIRYFGLIIGILHFAILCVSRHYNHVWFCRLKHWVNKKKSAKCDESIWSHLHETIEDHERTLGGVHSTHIAIWLSIIIVIFWIYTLL